MPFSIYWCTLKLAMNNSQNMLKRVTVHGKVQFVGNNPTNVYQLHGGCAVFNFHLWFYLVGM